MEQKSFMMYTEWIKKGVGSFDDVVDGWNILQKYGVDTNILCTIHNANAKYPLDIYRFFRDELGANHIQFIPIVERATPETILQADKGWGSSKASNRPLYLQQGSLVTNRSVKPLEFGNFLCDIFDEWVKNDVGTVFVNTFDVALGSWLGMHNACIVSPTCGASITMEYNGDIYSCDHFVEPNYLLGNIHSMTLHDILTSKKQQKFGSDKYNTLTKYCLECPVLFACYGECPKNRFTTSPQGEYGQNYLCDGYKLFYTHINEPIKKMAGLVRSGKYADEIMSTINT